MNTTASDSQVANLAFTGPVDDFAEARAALGPVFIGGCVRSATTWAYRVLAQHSALHPPGGSLDHKELRFYDRVLTSPQPSAVGPVLFGELMYVCGKFFADRIGTGTRWLDGTPPNHEAFRHLLEWYPNARCIMRIRHPQEMFWSARKTPWNRDKPAHVLFGQNGANWKKAARTWLSLEEQPDPRVGLFRHEDLVAHPERQIREMFALADVEPTEEMIARGTGWLVHSTAQSVVRVGHMTERRNVVDARSYFLERRREIAADEAFCARVVREVGDLMGELGYHCLTEDIERESPVPTIAQVPPA